MPSGLGKKFSKLLNVFIKLKIEAFYKFKNKILAKAYQ